MIVKLTRVSVPVKVVIGVAMTLVVKSGLLIVWTVGEWDVVVRDVVEKVELVLWKKKTGSD